MGAVYTKAQKKASDKYLKKLDETKLRTPAGMKKKWSDMAAAEGKSLTQFIIDRVENYKD